MTMPEVPDQRDLFEGCRATSPALRAADAFLA